MFRSLFAWGLLIGMTATGYCHDGALLLPVPENTVGGCAESQPPSCGCSTGIQVGLCCGQCSTCPLPECGVCGTGRCWDCSDAEGIDVDSLTAAAQSKKLYDASLARIKVELPEDAAVWLQNQRMTTAGEKRSFVVSVSHQDKTYKYEVKVDVVRNGKKYFKTYKIEELRAGMILTLVVVAPKAETEEDVKIEIKDKDTLDAKGGVEDSELSAPAAGV